MGILSSKTVFGKILVLLSICILGFLTEIVGASEKDVSTGFEYYSKHNTSVPINKTEFEGKLTKKVVFYIHGWMGGKDLEDSDSRKIKDGIFDNRKDVDVVVLVDWLEASNDWYYFTVAEYYVPKVAVHVKDEIEWLNQVHAIKTAKIELVAHSLGAHIMGQAGKLWNDNGLGPKIAKMTALDAAGPGFRDKPKVRICKADAKFVRAIHTDNRYGIFDDVGHEDIYPYTQDVILNCEKQMNDHICLHRAAKDLYLEELAGAILVDPKEPKKGKDRFKNNLLRKPHQKRRISILILDVSPSMQDHGRMENMIVSTKRYITTLPLGTSVGIVVFGGHAKISLPVETIRDEITRQSIIANVSAINITINGTSIGAGLQAAMESFTQLDKGPTRSCPDLVVITDGEENTAPYRRDVESRLSNCTRVNSIALGADADKGLEELSQKTKGLTASVDDFHSLNRLTQSLLDSSSLQLEPAHRPIKLPTKRVKLDTSQGTDFHFDKGLGKDTKFFINIPDSLTIFPKITAPNGKIYKFSESSMENYRNAKFLNIPYAMHGKWNLKLNSITNQMQLMQGTRLLGATLNTSKLPSTTVFVTTMPNRDGEVPIRLEGRLSSNIIDYSSPEIVKIEAKLTKGDNLILDAHVQVILTPHHGKGRVKIILLDNGCGSDEMKDDGVYSAQVVQALSLGIRYEASVIATNGSNSKIMPAEMISFAPPEPSEKAKLHTAYKFEREVNLGSVKSINEYKPFLPTPVRDLKVIRVDIVERLCSLNWTAAGNSGDFGTAAGLEIRSTTNYARGSSMTERDDDFFVFDSSDVVSGSLEPVAAGQTQGVTLRIPEVLWAESGGGLHLYFVVRTRNSEFRFSEGSNVASSLYVLQSLGTYLDVDELSPFDINFYQLSCLLVLLGVISAMFAIYCICRKIEHIARCRTPEFTKLIIAE